MRSYRLALGLIAIVVGAALMRWIQEVPVSLPRENTDIDSGTKSSTPVLAATPLTREEASSSFFEDTESATLDTTGVYLLPDLVDLSKSLNSPGSTAGNDIETLQSLIALYRRFNNGINPEGGSNPEITAKLLGRNRKKLAVLAPAFATLDDEGQLLDRWGSPYIFHQVSPEVLQIRSAGPDRELWTNDDEGPGLEAEKEDSVF